MNANSEKWALIPSDPAIFQDMIQQYGIDEAQAEEVFALEFLDESKDNTDLHGLILISGYVEESLPVGFERPDPLASDIVFTAQLVTNACATLALLAILFNANINKGPIINHFLEFTEDFSPIDRGMCLASSHEIRAIHDAYASNANHLAEDVMMDVAKVHDNADCELVDAENYHYVSYIYKNGYVWELDGLKSQPLRVAQCTHENWIAVVKPILQERMQDRVDVSLLAITRDDYPNKLKQQDTYRSYLGVSRDMIKKKCSKEVVTERRSTYSNLFEEADTEYRDKMDAIWNLMGNSEFVSAEGEMGAFEMEIDSFNQHINQLTADRKTARDNSTRQKFDYFPFLKALFTASIQHGLLHDTSKASKRSPTNNKKSKIPPKKSTAMKRKPASKKAARKSS
ncbi:hypothetical protein MBANPS3_009806 [Mucor bainieri]